jgi:hypothetical protein
MTIARFQRYELKYFVSEQEMQATRSMIAPFTEPDPFSVGCPGGLYTVRSIYFDTADLRFYYEKDAGTSIRKKLRLRTYNRYCREAVGFYEIKRKYGTTILKERVGMPFDRAVALLQEHPAHRLDPESIAGLELSLAARATLERFFFLEQVLPLLPVVLIVYDREAYVGAENPRVRITFDCDVRSAMRPGIEEIFVEKGLRRLADRRQILEVKFDGAMPAWVRPVTRMLDRSHGPISKYCSGIDLWGPADEVIGGLRALN